MSMWGIRVAGHTDGAGSVKGPGGESHYQNVQKPLCHPQSAAQRVFHSARNAYRSTLDFSATKPLSPNTGRSHGCCPSALAWKAIIAAAVHIPTPGPGRGRGKDQGWHSWNEAGPRGGTHKLWVSNAVYIIWKQQPIPLSHVILFYGFLSTLTQHHQSTKQQHRRVTAFGHTDMTNASPSNVKITI